MDNDEQWQGLLRKCWLTNTLKLERSMCNELTGEAHCTVKEAKVGKID